ncbi:hypothetical protein OUZ56_012226 [Daphnia magna]|uniref:Uncharacterized protein n=1 Tax=Daphnia magna TaxID=35525 RepID=A0ABQ9Z2P9_9CRUS|nr:hypothetical protein OUZ56_012226 [Daphnia magna]
MCGARKTGGCRDRYRAGGVRVFAQIDEDWGRYRRSSNWRHCHAGALRWKKTGGSTETSSPEWMLGPHPDRGKVVRKSATRFEWVWRDGALVEPSQALQRTKRVSTGEPWISGVGTIGQMEDNPLIGTQTMDQRGDGVRNNRASDRKSKRENTPVARRDNRAEEKSASGAQI